MYVGHIVHCNHYTLHCNQLKCTLCSPAMYVLHIVYCNTYTLLCNQLKYSDCTILIAFLYNEMHNAGSHSSTTMSTCYIDCALCSASIVECSLNGKRRERRGGEGKKRIRRQFWEPIIMLIENMIFKIV